MNLWLRFIIAGAMSITFSVPGLVFGALTNYVVSELTGSYSYGEVPFAEHFHSALASLGWQAGLIGGALIGYVITKDIKLRITTDGE